MACLRASFASAALLRSSRSIPSFDLGPVSSGSLQAGQRLAKPGLPGFSSNSSEHTAQTRTGNTITLIMINPYRPPRRRLPVTAIFRRLKNGALMAALLNQCDNHADRRHPIAVQCWGPADSGIEP